MTNKPLVSVIIPTYRRNKGLVRAVESVKEQSYMDLDIIVVNDAPENKLPDEISSDEEVTVLHHEDNRGGAAARNTGLKESQGRYVAFLDDDDFFHREKITRQVKKLENAGSDCLGNFTWHLFYSSEEDLKFEDKEFVRENNDDMVYRLLRGFGIRVGGCSSLLLERKAIQEIGGFDERLQRHQDWELMLRLLEDGKIETVSEPLFSKVGYTKPSAKKLRKTKQLYLEKFSTKIDSLPEEKRRRVYRDNYSLVSESFFRENRYLKGILWFLKAARYTENLSTISYSEWPPRIDNRA